MQASAAVDPMDQDGPHTHSLLRLPLVSLHFGLQLVHQVLEPEDVLAVLLCLQTQGLCQTHSLLHLRRSPWDPGGSHWGFRRVTAYLVSHLLDLSLVSVGALQSLGPPLLLSIQLAF